MDTIKFNSKNHTYTNKNNENVLSVTKVLPDIPEHLLYNQNFIRKTIIGTKTHEFAERANQHFKKTQKIRSIRGYGGDCKAYCAAYQKFLKDIQPKIFAIEQRLFHPIYHYAGTLDLVCNYNNFITLFDIKTTSVIDAKVKLQTAAYYTAYNHDRSRNRAQRRGIIHLKPNGQYAIKLLPIKQVAYDFNIFLCKLKSAMWDFKNLKGN